ncbi:hypothetical protein GO491_12130, partial [Flavobacteriaceae bacterium Ap0902]|nr:hypothetical protein [Flavobacteriaceae bacterium Ap0902]
DKNIGAFSLDKVNAIKDNKLGNALETMGYPVDVVAAYTGHPATAALSGVINGNTLIGEAIIAQETGQYSDLKKKGTSTLVNEVVGRVIESKQGKQARAAYEAMIAPVIKEYLTK